MTSSTVLQVRAEFGTQPTSTQQLAGRWQPGSRQAAAKKRLQPADGGPDKGTKRYDMTDEVDGGGDGGGGGWGGGWCVCVCVCV